MLLAMKSPSPVSLLCCCSKPGKDRIFLHLLLLLLKGGVLNSNQQLSALPLLSTLYFLERMLTGVKLAGKACKRVVHLQEF
jgi:hypothetical protein